MVPFYIYHFQIFISMLYDSLLHILTFILTFLLNLYLYYFMVFLFFNSIYYRIFTLNDANLAFNSPKFLTSPKTC